MENAPARPLTTAEVAALFGVHPATLRRWRQQGVGPAYSALSTKTFRYHPEDVAAYLATKNNRGAFRDRGGIVEDAA